MTNFFHSVMTPTVSMTPDASTVTQVAFEGLVSTAPDGIPVVETKVSHGSGKLGTVVIRFDDFPIYVTPEQAIALRNALTEMLR